MTAAPKVPTLFRVRTVDDLDRIPFVDGMAAVEVPADLLDDLKLTNYERGDSPRLEALKRSIRNRGFQPVEPITARVDSKGNWVILNGGHRITAAKAVRREVITNLFGPKVRSLYFVLFTNVGTAALDGAAPLSCCTVTPPDDAATSRAAWERSRRRMRDVDVPAAAPSA